MTCENELCIYQEKGSCMLDVMKLNSLGACKSCTVVNIPQVLLWELKKAHRKELEERNA